MKNPFKRKPKVKKERTVSVGREYFELIVETLIYVFFVNTFLLQSFVIPTASMEKTLLIGDHLLVNKVAYSNSISPIGSLLLPQVKIRRGMVVTFKAPPDLEKEYVKRVIGMPGDRLRISDKKVFINGRPLAEGYTVFKSVDYGAEFPPRNSYDWYFQFPIDLRKTQENPDGSLDYIVPPGHYFCMGDNRDNSFDSRFWGPVPANYIVGKPWRIYWSYESNSDEYLTPGFIYKIKDLALTVTRFFTRTRWDRTIKAIK
ncbi:MAG TPA: signal peptidase I [Patescibacteria group bacterium]|nr:signal peptidase I [Patescibacteria group bacterium]